MRARHAHYCEDSAALGEAFPDLVGGVIGLALGLVRGSLVTARRLAEDAILTSPRRGSPSCGCGCVHHVHVYDCGPCSTSSGCWCCR